MNITEPAAVKSLLEHPCFSDEAHDRIGRIHLPVAPRCNIQCNYCERRICADIQHPGWAARLLSEAEAVGLVRSVIAERQACDFVVGVAGPGDALANDETFHTFARINELYPQLTTCLCTNGLLLDDRLEEIAVAGVKTITVTVNATDSRVGKDIYSRVHYQGTTYRDEEAAAILIEKQFIGIEMAVAAGFHVKVNTVLIPGVNDLYMLELACRLRYTGVTVMNIMPLIPAGKMKNYRSPSCNELQNARRQCTEVIPQFHRCQRCRADIIFLPPR
ncbi:MAG TPA: radical SAM protein [Dehalococcoidia bacterium]|nr:radical SAM protein [Dehalococcoidia bacterium]